MPARAAALLAALPSAPLAQALSQKWDAAPHRSSASKWSDIDALAGAGDVPGLDARRLLEAKQDVVLEHTYPRLDAAVSRHRNHLLKAPFCVHPGTGRVCVPVDPASVDEFDPFDVPTVTELLAEVDAAAEERAVEGKGDSGGADEHRRAPDWEKTRLRPYVEYFRRFVHDLLKTEGASGGGGGGGGAGGDGGGGGAKRRREDADRDDAGLDF